MFSKIYYISQENKYEIRINQAGPKMAWTKVNIKYPDFSRLCQFLFAIYSKC